MMPTVESVKFHIDFSSNYRLSGWALDMATNKFPKTIELHASNDAHIDLSAARRVLRIDVCEHLGLPSDLALGFEVNLLDVFNDRLDNYELLCDGDRVWSKKEHFATLEQVTPLTNDKLMQQHGSKQVVVIYRENGWLHQLLLGIHTWSPVYFDKGYQSGVSFLFVNIRGFSEKKDIVLRQNGNCIIFVEDCEYRHAFDISPTLFRTRPVIVLNNEIDLSGDVNGLLSVIATMAGMANGTLYTASTFVAIISCLAAYGDLMFNCQSDLFFFQSGTLQPWMKDKMREEIQKKESADVVILSDKCIMRLSDVQPSYCAIFIRTWAVRFFYDVLNESLIDFLNSAYKRGARVRVITRGELK